MNFGIINRRKHNKSNKYPILIKIGAMLIVVYLACRAIELVTSDVSTTVSILIFAFALYKVSDIINYLTHKNITFTEKQFNLILSAFSPRQFEVFCYELFKALGYKAHLTPEGPDGGKDVIVNSNIYVECKRYNSTMIGREICQKLLGALTADKMKEGIIFTNGQIHQNAIDFMHKTDKIKLWDSKIIYEKANSLKSYKLSRLIDMVLESE